MAKLDLDWGIITKFAEDFGIIKKKASTDDEVKSSSSDSVICNPTKNHSKVNKIGINEIRSIIKIANELDRSKIYNYESYVGILDDIINEEYVKIKYEHDDIYKSTKQALKQRAEALIKMATEIDEAGWGPEYVNSVDDIIERELDKYHSYDLESDEDE